jgi:GTP-binding protein HflX
MWTHLDRQQAAGQPGTAGIGTRGPGETQIELDRRIVSRRIHRLKRELEEIERQHHTRASGRRDYFTISLVGYTNAGKSTLLRSLTGAETLIEDRLFATLDTTTRAWTLPSGKRVFLSDTVGFIRGLPHHLVASFHATLEETREADLLLHVVDASNPDAESQMRTVGTVLEEVEAGDVPVVVALNKTDLIEDPMQLSLIRPGQETSVPISAATGEGLPDLGGAVDDVVEGSQVELTLTAHPGDGRLLAFLADKGTILEQEYLNGEEVRIVARLPRRYAAELAAKTNATGS